MSPDAPANSSDTPETEEFSSTLSDPFLASVVLEVEGHVAQEGWGNDPRLFILTETNSFIDSQPEMAAAMKLVRSPRDESLTAAEQPVDPSRPIEEFLLTWVLPEWLSGCAVSLERTVLPPHVEDQIPADPEEASKFALNHPERQVVRMVVGASRSGGTYCALRFQAHDFEEAVVDGTDLVPELIELVRHTLAPVSKDGDPA